MKKSKLISSLAALVLTIACLTFGVYSAVKTTFTASGSISFNAYGLDVLVEGTITNAVAAENGTLNAKYYGATKSDHSNSNYTGKVGTDGNLPQWDMGAIGFNELDTTQTDETLRNTITITLKITNYSGFAISANPTLKFGTNGQETEATFTSTFASSTTNNAKKVADTAGSEGTLTITLSPKSLTSAINGSFKLDVEIKPYSEADLLKWDSAGYWYLEMGHLDDSANSPIKWRLISNDCTTPYNPASEKDRPASLKGIYFLQSYDTTLAAIDTNFRTVVFDRGGTDTQSADCSENYYYSEIRSYLLGNDITNSKSGKAYYYSLISKTYNQILVSETNLRTDFNISQDNEIYKRIKKVAIDKNGTDIDLNTTNGTDDFWLLPLSMHGSIISTKSGQEIIDAEDSIDGSWGAAWWTSCPNGMLEKGINISGANGWADGNPHECYTFDYNGIVGVRPAFQIG